jgi:hypothetical protein
MIKTCIVKFTESNLIFIIDSTVIEKRQVWNILRGDTRSAPLYKLFSSMLTREKEESEIWSIESEFSADELISYAKDNFSNLKSEIREKGVQLYSLPKQSNDL